MPTVMTATAVITIVPARHQHERIVMHLHRGSLTLRTCAICLRVLRRRTWIAAETIILEQRSFERSSLPRLQPALCAACVESIHQRRVRPAPRLAA